MRSASLRVVALAVLLVAGTVAACSESTSPSLAGTGQTMSLSFAGTAAAAMPAPAGRLPGQAPAATTDTLVVVVGTDTLKITSAQVVLRRISLKRVEGSAMNCDTMPENSDGCEDFTLRDLLVSLPLTAGVQTALTVAVDSGHYQGVEFKIHKAGGDSIDTAFRTANPGFDTISVKVQGTFNGTPFTFVSRMDVEEEFDFSPPLVVDASGTATNLTLRLDLTTWFKTGGGALIDPSTANPGGANEGLVTSNIERSAKAFEDRNKDDDETNG